MEMVVLVHEGHTELEMATEGMGREPVKNM